MAQLANPYPSLTLYLKSAKLAESIQAIKRPENWVRYLYVACIPFAIIFHVYWQIIAIGLLTIPVGNWLYKRRLGAKTSAEAFRLDMQNRFGPIVRRKLRSGQLVLAIGADGASSLERCAALALAAHGDLTRTIMLSTGLQGSKELLQEVSQGIERAMNKAFRCYEPNLLGPIFAKNAPIGDISQIEAELNKLADEISKWSIAMRGDPDKVDLSSLRSRLQTMREFETALKSGQVALGAVDLEAEARQRDT